MTRFAVRFVSIVAVLFVPMLSGADWPQFRGPGGSGVSDDTGLPVSWTAEENVIWKTALPGFGASSPIVLGEKIFLTAYSGYGLDGDEPGQQEDLRLHVLCADRKTGEIIWDKSTEARPGEQEYGRMIGLHGYASGTPATDGQAVYAFFGRSGVKAYDLDGKLLWSALVGDGTDKWGSATSPILTDKLVIINASIESQSLVALDKSTGEEVWRTEGINRSWATPALVDLDDVDLDDVDLDDGKQEIVVSMEGEVRGYDPASGEQLWNCKAVQDYVTPLVIAHEGIVYVTGGRTPLTIAIRAGGTGNVTESHVLWKLKKTSKITSPLLYEGHLYWVSQRGVAGCIDAASGEVIYEERLKISGGGDKVYASLALADGKLYAVSRQGGTFVLALGEEFKQLAHNDLGDESVFNATPAFCDGKLLLRSNRYLYCIGQ